MRIHLLSFLAVSVLASGAAIAQQAPSVCADANEDEGFIGVLWDFSVASPSLIVGYRDVDVDCGGDVDGWQAALTFDLNRGFDKLRIDGVWGDEDVQGIAGAGYSIANKSFLIGAGAQGPYLFGGVDYLPQADMSWSPYVGVNSIGKYDVPAPALPPQPE